MLLLVALLAEGVDRNIRRGLFCRAGHVALLAEGVDRNIGGGGDKYATTLSPSSRRAWIEILRLLALPKKVFVALLAEGVDRNWKSWTRFTTHYMVALLAEGVDRNR